MYASHQFDCSVCICRVGGPTCTYPTIKAAAVLIHFPSPSGFLGILDSSKLNVTSVGNGGGGAEADRVDICFGFGLEWALRRVAVLFEGRTR
jgi:hypothetical protein